MGEPSFRGLLYEATDWEAFNVTLLLEHCPDHCETDADCIGQQSYCFSNNCYDSGCYCDDGDASDSCAAGKYCSGNCKACGNTNCPSGQYRSGGAQ